MSSNPLRIVLVILLAVGGGLVIANGFDGDATVASEPDTPATPSATQSPEKDKGGGQPTNGQTGTEIQEGRVDGVRIVVYNGTSTALIAAEVDEKLAAEGAVQDQEPSNTLGNEPVTTLYYRTNEDLPNAEFMTGLNFLPKGTEVAPLDGLPPVETKPDRSVQVAVVVGEDYLA